MFFHVSISLRTSAENIRDVIYHKKNPPFPKFVLYLIVLLNWYSPSPFFWTFVLHQGHDDIYQVMESFTIFPSSLWFPFSTKPFSHQLHSNLLIFFFELLDHSKHCFNDLYGLIGIRLVATPQCSTFHLRYLSFRPLKLLKPRTLCSIETSKPLHSWYTVSIYFTNNDLFWDFIGHLMYSPRMKLLKNSLKTGKQWFCPPCLFTSM